MGVKRVEVAKKVQFNINISDSEFKLPNYPIKSYREVMSGPDSQKGDNNQPSQEEIQQMMKQFMGGKN